MKQLGEICVREYMTEQATVVDDTARLTDAIRLMDSKKLSVLPVVDEQGRLVGILSNSDLIEITHEIQSDLGALRHVNEKTRDFLIKILMEARRLHPRFRCNDVLLSQLLNRRQTWLSRLKN